MSFEPIAIVGRGCVLPGALDPDTFWDNVAHGRTSLAAVPAGRWRLRHSLALGTLTDSVDRTWTDVGGYVDEASVAAAFEAAASAPARREAAGLDPLFQWVLHGAGQALREAGAATDGTAGDGTLSTSRAGLVLGNLSFPTAEMARYAEHVLVDSQSAAVRRLLADSTRGERPDPRNRFSSGLPAHLAARTLGLRAGSFALDAACASSLYAVKLACDRLHDRTADLMVAGAVNCVDDLQLHVGFCALSAMSRGGRSRPFDRAADGLVPAEGAAFVALMRLPDALAAGRRVFGVVRGVGLSNDGSRGGLLAPSEDGQVRAMLSAYAQAGLAPETVSLVECHATGTLVGDATEAGAMARVFGSSSDVPVGSVKGNIGHPVTAAGMAGLLKVLGAMSAGVRPPSVGVESPIEQLGTPLRLLTEAEPWTGLRRAAVSAFGFGGNNAHLVVDAWEEPAPAGRGGATGQPVPAAGSVAAPADPEPVAVVAVGARVADGADAGDFVRLLLDGRGRDQGPQPQPRGRRATVEVKLAGLRFPPRDLERALPQQLLVMEAVREAVDGVVLPRRTVSLVGMGCDPAATRYHARWRVAEWLAAPDGSTDGESVAGFRAAISPPMAAADVLGTMPNLVANRINAQLDLTGPGFSVSAEEASGLVALDLAVRMLAVGEADAAVVGAVDLSHEPVHQAALAELGRSSPVGDAAVALVLKRERDARRDGDRVLALIDVDPAATDDPAATGDRDDPDGQDDPDGRPDVPPGGTEMLVGDQAAGRQLVGDARGESVGFDPAELAGTAHAASGLVAAAAAAVALHHRVLPRPGGPAEPSLGIRTADVVVAPLGAPPARVRLRCADAAGWFGGRAPALRVFSGQDVGEVLAALDAGRESGAGPARLVVLADGPEQLASRGEAARRWLTGKAIRPDGVAFRERPLGGEVGFVYTNGSAAYPGMGRDLVVAFPDVMAELEARCGPVADTVGWAYGRGQVGGEGQTHVLDQIWGAALLSQVHTELTRGLLGVRPSAALGYSSGESAALVALGAWHDVPGLVADLDGSEVFSSGLVGEFTAARQAWRRIGVDGQRWASYLVTAPVADVRRALAGARAVHLMAVNAPGVCVVGGEDHECARIVAGLPGQAVQLRYNIAVHAPEVAEVRDEWWRLHHRPTRPVPGVRFYTGASEESYVPTPTAAADAVTAQALGTIDFVRMVERAWSDGVRVFVEHGPGGQCSSWVSRILGDRDHLAVPLDSAERGGVGALVRAVAELVAVGVPLDPDPLFRRLAAVSSPAAARASAEAHAAGAYLTVPAHPAPPRLPEPVEPVGPVGPAGPPAQVMVPAPRLAPVSASQLGAQAGGAGPAGWRSGAPSVAAAIAAAPLPDAVLPPPRPAAVTASRPATAAPVANGSRPPAPLPASPPVDGQLAILSAATRGHQQALSTAFQEFTGSRAHAHRRLLAVLPDLVDRPAAAAAEIYPGAAVETAVETGSGTEAGAGASAQVEAEAEAEAHVAAEAVATVLPGPKFGRAELEHLATGRISDLFGPLFAPQDHLARQTRMPQPPMLLADRVTGIEGAAASMGTGVLWTETDVRADGWYLDPAGRMPAGIMVEAGQADLLLISWLGIDLVLGGDRVYRLLGCELTFHGPLAVPGETLAYEISVDGHGAHDGVRLFFFHYDCHVGGELRLSVRDGQAGFFTDAELAATGGVLWDPAAEPPDDDLPLDPPAVGCEARRFGRDAVRALADGRLADCFGSAGGDPGSGGPGSDDRWRVSRAHVRPPRLADGRMLLLDEVTDFDPRGGPWGRGYLHARTAVSPSDWFFEGHFKNDPCMPGTLMLEGCLQAMSFYLAACGFTVDRDGWRFEPVPDVPVKMVCRGQVTPASRLLTYEVFVLELSAAADGGEPTLYADVLCTVDGVRAFHARRVGLRLVRDFPLAAWRECGPPAVQRTGSPVPLSALGGLAGYREPGPVATAGGFEFGYPALLASAWGRPSEAFGPVYGPAEDLRLLPRLPGPPYHFVSRVLSVSGPPGQRRDGIEATVEYDVPDGAWYFEQNLAGGGTTMPFAVLMEIALQPCGWLASYAGCALAADGDVLFRNLGGTATVTGPVRPGSGPVRTTTKLRQLARNGSLTVVSFDVVCQVAGEVVFETSTTFGFFPPEAFVDQVGLPPTDDERARFAVSDARPTGPAVTGPATADSPVSDLAGPMLAMIDRVVGCWPADDGEALARLRAEKDLDANEWFFKSHFFADPVQPGSLGLEAMCQLLQYYLVEQAGIEQAGAGQAGAEPMRRPRFEPVMLGRPVTWKYRGQVVPSNRKVTVEMAVRESGEDDRGRYAVADAWLWADDIRIYQVSGIGMRVVEPASRHSGSRHSGETVLDLAVDTWLADHCPTWTVPAVPMMSTVDRLARAAADHFGRNVVQLRDVQLYRWLPVRDSVRLLTQVRELDQLAGEVDPRAGATEAEATEAEVVEAEVTLLVWRDAPVAALSRFEPVASGVVRVGPRSGPVPAPTAPPTGTEPADDPYASGVLFHGPAFQYLTSVRNGDGCASGVLDAAGGQVPRGLLHQGLLDAAIHVIPHDNLWTWSDEIGRDVAGFPHRIVAFDVYAPLPDSGEVRVGASFAGFDGGDRSRPVFDVVMWDERRTYGKLRLVDALVPKGRVGTANPVQRRAFLRDRRYAGGVGVSGTHGGVTRLTETDVDLFDWLPGTVADLYGLPAGARGRDHVARIAVADHVGRLAGVHPADVVVAADLSLAWPALDPERRFAVTVERDGDEVVVRGHAENSPLPRPATSTSTL